MFYTFKKGNITLTLFHLKTRAYKTFESTYAKICQSPGFSLKTGVTKNLKHSRYSDMLIF